MIRSLRSRLVAVSTGVLLTAATVGTLAPVAQAETAAGQIPATITATPTTGLVSGSTVTVSATADTNWNIYSLRARLCSSDAAINNAGDFSPTLGGNCIDQPLAAGTDSDVTVTTDPGSRGAASLNFKVGAGSTTFTTQYDGARTIACGVTSASGCKLVVEMSAANLSARVIYKSFDLTFAAPNAPTAVSGAWGNAKAKVSWTASAAQTGLPAVTSYTVTASPGGATCTTSGTSCEVTGLTNGTDYTFTVTGTNALGTSAPSTASAVVTPSSDPFRITTVPTTGIRSGDTVTQTVTMSSGLSLYSVRSRLCLTAATISNAGDFSPTLGGNCIDKPLAVGTDSDDTVTTTAGNRGSASLDFKVGAGSTTFTTQYDGSRTISCGPSAPTACALDTEISYTTALGAARLAYVSAPLTYATAPATPAAPTATLVAPAPGALTRSVAVSWTAPATGGSTITGYRVEASPQVLGVTRFCTTNGATTCTVTGLTKAVAYTFTVRASNAVGDSAYSASSQSMLTTTTNVPALSTAPTALTVTDKVNGSFTITWTAPTGNGGASITKYTVTATATGQTTRSCEVAFGAPLTCTLSPVANGVKYTLSVSAVNSVGSKTSTLKNQIAQAAPGAPTNVAGSQTSATAAVKVAWTGAPANGSAITAYNVTVWQGNTQVVGKSCSTTGTTFCSISGLAKGTAYTFKVTATNGQGTGPAGSGTYTTRS